MEQGGEPLLAAGIVLAAVVSVVAGGSVMLGNVLSGRPPW